MDTNEVLANLERLCKASKFSYEEHEYLQNGLKEIKKKLMKLETLEKTEPKEPEGK
jgi:hypothetical protein